jgi:Na+-driven multidrug efflux pump
MKFENGKILRQLSKNTLRIAVRQIGSRFIVVVILGLAVFLGAEYFAQLFTRDENVLRTVHGIWYAILIGYALGAIIAYWQLSAKKWLAKQV